MYPVPALGAQVSTNNWTLMSTQPKQGVHTGISERHGNHNAARQYDALPMRLAAIQPVAAKSADGQHFRQQSTSCTAINRRAPEDGMLSKRDLKPEPHIAIGLR